MMGLMEYFVKEFHLSVKKIYFDKIYMSEREEYYKEKYIKYKTKYINLKLDKRNQSSQKGGSIRPNNLRE